MQGDFMSEFASSIFTGSIRSTDQPFLNRMLLLSWAIFLVTMSMAPALGRPRILEGSEILIPPDPEVIFFPFDMALDRDRLIVATGSANAPQLGLRRLWLFERVNGRWGFVSKLLEVTGEAHPLPSHVALEGDVAALAFRNELHVLERSANGWQHTALGTPSGIGDMGSDVAIDGGRIVVGGETGRHQAIIFEKRSDGQWGYSAHVTAGPVLQDLGDVFGGDVDVQGDTIVVPSSVSAPGSDPSQGKNGVYVFTHARGVWTLSTVLDEPPNQSNPFGRSTMLHGNQLLVHAALYDTMYVYSRIEGTWLYSYSLEPRNAIDSSAALPEPAGDLFVQGVDDGVRRGGTVLVYQPQDGRLEPVAKLYAGDLTIHEFLAIHVRGRTVAAARLGGVHIFNLPEDLSEPPLVQDNFEDGNAHGWSPLPLSAWTITQRQGTKVYRQTRIDGLAFAALGSAHWMNQSIQAEVTPTAFDRGDQWAGLSVRFQDTSNHYFLALRSSNQLQLRKVVNGSFQTIASRATPILVNQTYRLRLEAVGTRIRGFLNGILLLDAVDESLQQGRPALFTSRAQAEYDNVLVSPSPLRPLAQDSFEAGAVREWTLPSGIWVGPPEYPADPEEPDPDAERRVLTQTSTSGGARALSLFRADDQVVQVSVSPTDVRKGWVGAIARFVNGQNFYSLQLFNGTIVLHKMVNGTHFQLDKASAAMTTNTWYKLRLEVVGTSLRGYLNDRFLLEATDNTHREGHYGMATYNAAAKFDDVSITQP
jgi:hypothetical protein